MSRRALSDRERQQLPQPGRLARALGWSQAALVLTALALFLRCQGPPYWWVLLATGLPGLRLLASPSYRRLAGDRLRRLWADLEDFPQQSSSLPWRAVLALVVLPAGLLFLSQREHLMTGDTQPVTLTATSLVREGRCELSHFMAHYELDPAYNLAWTGKPYFLAWGPKGLYSGYPSGMVPFALPATALAHWLGADLDRPRVHVHLEKGAASWVAAGCVGLFFLIARHLVDARSAWVASLLLATGSALFSTVAQSLWQQGGVAFWMLTALLVEVRTWRRPSLAGCALQGMAVAMMLACRTSAAVLILPLGLWVFCRAPRRAILVGLCATLAYLPWALFYRAIYGTVLGPSAYQGIGTLWCRPTPKVLAYLFFSPDHGLVTYQPWLVLGLAAWLWRRRTPASPPGEWMPPGWRLCLAACIVLHLGLLSTWRCWWGGDCWGCRLATEIVPLCALFCVRPIAVAWASAPGRRVVLAMAILACFLHASGVYFKANYNAFQPGLLSHRPEPPGSWQHAPFLSPFVARLR